MQHEHNTTRGCRVGTVRLARRLRWLPLIGLLLALQAGAATLTVTTLDDNTDNDGECSLREAVRNASDDVLFYDDCPAGTGDDVIEFDAGLFSGSPPEATIMLTGQLKVGDGGGPSGALSIASSGKPSHRLARLRFRRTCASGR
jgi:CSLREA domain-containing protein